MQSTSCHNCGAMIEPGAVFCSRCGQKTNLHRFTMPHLSHEIVHAVTHTDKGIFFLIRELTLRPGEVLYNYLSRHQRKKYFSPFTFLLLMAGLLLLSNSTFKPYQSDKMIPKEQKAATEQLMGKEKAAIIYKRTQKFNHFMEKNSKPIVLASVPLTALVFWLMFRRRGFYFAEHLVAAVFLTGYLSLFMAVVVTPLMSFFDTTAAFGILSLVSVVFQLFYFGWAYHRFLAAGSSLSPWAPYLVSLLNLVIWSVLTITASMVYIYSGVLF